MRYVLESLSHHTCRNSSAPMVVERVFIIAGARQYNCVECDTAPGFEKNKRYNKNIKKIGE